MPPPAANTFPGYLPLVWPPLHRFAATVASSYIPSQSGLHLAFLSARTNLSCGTAALSTTNSKWQSSHRSSEQLPASFLAAHAHSTCFATSQLQHAAVWDSFITNLTAAASQYASQLPNPHKAQLPVPAHNLNQPFTLKNPLRPSYATCTTAGQRPSLATLQSCCGLHSCQLTQTRLHHTTC